MNDRSGTIEQLSYDKDLSVWTATYIAGIIPGGVTLTASIDGNIVATAEILLTPATEAVSEILINSFSNNVLVGKTVRITGVITPPFSSAPIDLEILTPTGFSWLEHTKAQSDGAFNFHIRLDEPGAWRFRAIYRQVSSSIVIINVEAQPYTGHFGGNWSKYTTADGLGHTFVHFLFEDNRGAIWAATFGGVSKLEGDRWRTYTTADGLGSNLAFFLLEDSRGILWAATAEGISRFDRNLVHVGKSS